MKWPEWNMSGVMEFVINVMNLDCCVVVYAE